MEDTRKRFQNLLRDVLNQFIDKDLPKAISKELFGGQLASESAAVAIIEAKDNNETH